MSKEVYELISKLDMNSFMATGGDYDNKSYTHAVLYKNLAESFDVLLSRPKDLSLVGENWLECAFNDESISDDQFLIFLSIIFELIHKNIDLEFCVFELSGWLQSLQKTALSGLRFRVERALSFCHLVMVGQLMESAPGVASVVDVSSEDGVDVDREGEGEESKCDDVDEDTASTDTESVDNQKFYRCAIYCYFLVGEDESHVISNDEMCYLIYCLKKELVIFLPNVSQYLEGERYKKELGLFKASPFIRQRTLFYTVTHFYSQFGNDGFADAKKGYVNFFVAIFPHFTDKSRRAFRVC